MVDFGFPSFKIIKEKNLTQIDQDSKRKEGPYQNSSSFDFFEATSQAVRHVMERREGKTQYSMVITFTANYGKLCHVGGPDHIT